ncbi:WYL domain-containing protein [Nonomuraea sp. NPDC005501]|uniref:WYL domain-containing protein n=1 Tax=Nonomuraea sp. NPDC005501 TaxID=3156884 RepID=UPI0033A91881
MRLHAPVEAVAGRIPPAAGLLTTLDPAEGESGCLLETGSESLHDLAGFLGSLGVPFSVLHPPELRAHLRDLAARYAAAAAEEGPR